MARTEHAQNLDGIAELADIMKKLRSPEGCPWDRKQTHESLKPYLSEESAEFFDAVDEDNTAAMIEELGDVLLQVVFQAQLGEEEGRFDLDEVARKCCEKIIRRHPHVFGEDAQKDISSDQVLRQWENIKQREGPEKKKASFLDGVPLSLSALHRAQEMQKKVAKSGFEFPSCNEALQKVGEETQELQKACEGEDVQEITDEIGDLLFSVVNVSRLQGVQAEQALHSTVKKFERRFRLMEKMLQDNNRNVDACGIEELDAYWEQTKKQEEERK